MTAVVLLALAVLVVPVPHVALGVEPGRWGHRGPTWGSARRKARREAALTWVLAVAAELRAGSDPNQAVRRCTRAHGVAPHAAAAAAIGADVADALRRDGEASGGRLLVTVAGAWSVATASGTRMAEILESAADGYRRTIAVERSLAVELAAPRATARLMSVLPLIGLAVATLIGADPLHWLLTTPLGLLTLILGLGFNLVGFLWIRQIVRALEARL